MLREIARNIWVIEQPLKFLGLEVGIRMTVIRLTNGEVIVISPIKIDAEIIKQINEIGDVSLIIAPNLYHHLFISDFKTIYPHAQIWAAPGLDLKRSDLNIDKILSHGTIGADVEYLLFAGFKILDLNRATELNEIVFYHRDSKTLILTDIAFHFDESNEIKTRLATKFLGGYKKLEPSRLEKFATTRKEKVKHSIQKVLRWDFNRVIMAHGSIIDREGKTKLKAGYEWFLSANLD